eukprot:5696966-Pyramimonas_sp.AAC.1
MDVVPGGSFRQASRELSTCDCAVLHPAQLLGPQTFDVGFLDRSSRPDPRQGSRAGLVSWWKCNCF